MICQKIKGNFKAYDQQGNIMPNVSQSDCKRWMNGERTFDYTKAPIQVQSQPQPVQQQPTAYDAEFIAKYQQAKEQGLI